MNGRSSCFSKNIHIGITYNEKWPEQTFESLSLVKSFERNKLLKLLLDKRLEYILHKM